MPVVLFHGPDMPCSVLLMLCSSAAYTDCTEVMDSGMDDGDDSSSSVSKIVYTSQEALTQNTI